MTQWQQKCQCIARGLLAVKLMRNLWKDNLCDRHIFMHFIYARLCVSQQINRNVALLLFAYFCSLPPPQQAVRHGGTRLRVDLWNHAGGRGLHRRAGAGEEVHHTLHVVQGAAVQTGTSCHIWTESYQVPLQKGTTATCFFFFFFVWLEGFWGISDTKVPHKELISPTGWSHFFVHALICLRRCREFGCYSVANFLQSFFSPLLQRTPLF